MKNRNSTPKDAARVHAALDLLEPEHREVLVLRFLEGMSYEDVASSRCQPRFVRACITPNAHCVSLSKGNINHE
jgi:hypothetical protein